MIASLNLMKNLMLPWNPVGKESTLVTLKTVNKWRDTLEDNHSPVVFHDLVKAFKSAVQQTEREEQQETGKYKVEGSVVFNALVNTCVRCVPTTLLHNLKLKDHKQKKFVLPSSSKKWMRFKHSVKSYLSDVIRVCGNF
ncbi:nucleolar complex protein 2 homolog isoform X2 [Saccoglossus kowalevskii]